MIDNASDGRVIGIHALRRAMGRLRATLRRHREPPARPRRQEPVVRPTARPSAYSFRLDLSLDELLARLNADGPWQWSAGHSHWYGDYIGAHPLPHDGVVRIYEESGRFVLNLRYRSQRADAAADYAALHDAVLSRFLPSLGARDIAPHEGTD